MLKKILDFNQGTASWFQSILIQIIRSSSFCLYSWLLLVFWIKFFFFGFISVSKCHVLAKSITVFDHKFGWPQLGSYKTLVVIQCLLKEPSMLQMLPFLCHQRRKQAFFNPGSRGSFLSIRIMIKYFSSEEKVLHLCLSVGENSDE